MKPKYKKIFFSISFIIVSLFFSIHQTIAVDKFNTSLKQAGGATGHKVVAPEQSSKYIYATIANTIKVLLDLVGVVFIILIIYAGYTWMLARGNEADAQKAKDTIIRAIIGLFIVLAAYAITTLVGKSL